MTSGDLFHNGTTHHVPPRIDLGSAATRYNVMTSGDPNHNWNQKGMVTDICETTDQLYLFEDLSLRSCYR
jgi:hypothetical protein